MRQAALKLMQKSSLFHYRSSKFAKSADLRQNDDFRLTGLEELILNESANK